MKCRGEDTRRSIVEEYILKPIAHLKLLDSQEKRSCTNDLLTDAYYCFSYEAKNGDDKGAFFCGSHAAKHFLELTEKTSLPLFNPLRSDSHDGGGGAHKTPNGRTWDAASKQLSNAINLLVVCWNVAPKGPLASIKEKNERYFYNPPYLRDVKAVNTILSKDPKGRTLQEMIAQLQPSGPLGKFGNSQPHHKRHWQGMRA
jgi:hypothetical protein